MIGVLRRDRAYIAAGFALALVLSACTVVEPSSAPVSTTPGSPSPGPSGSASPSTPTLAPTGLPGGLEPRPGLPPLMDGEVAGCVPECGAGRTAGGVIPAGRHQTRWFFGGYITFETDGTWQLIEDSNGELSMTPAGDGEYGVKFRLDPQLYLHGSEAAGVRLEAAAYVDWLTAHPDLVVSDPVPSRIGSTPAIAVDISLAATAGQDEADCAPDACITFIKSAAFDHVDGILGDDVYRFLFADVSYSGTEHLFLLWVEGRDGSHLAEVAPLVDDVLMTVAIPAQAR